RIEEPLAAASRRNDRHRGPDAVRERRLRGRARRPGSFRAPRATRSAARQLPPVSMVAPREATHAAHRWWRSAPALDETHQQRASGFRVQQWVTPQTVRAPMEVALAPPWVRVARAGPPEPKSPRSAAR